MEKRKIETKEEQGEAWNMGDATLKRIDECFINFKSYVKMQAIIQSITEIRFCLSEVSPMLSKENRSKIDELMDYINQTYIHKPGTILGIQKNYECLEPLLRIDCIIKEELWNRGFTMPKKESVTEQGGM